MAGKQDSSLIGDCKQSFEICDCEHHKGADIKHVAPCCSECPFCRENIKMACFNDHVTRADCNPKPSSAGAAAEGETMAVTDGGGGADEEE